MHISKKKKAYKQTEEYKAARAKKVKTAAKVGAAAAGTALAAYGAYKVNKFVKTKNAEIAAQRGFEAAEKMFKSNVTALTSGPGRATRGVINANSGQAALNAAREAAGDNFKTAARNVYRYRKKNGKSSLKYLDSVSNMARRTGSSMSWG